MSIKMVNNKYALEVSYEEYSALRSLGNRLVEQLDKLDLEDEEYNKEFNEFFSKAVMFARSGSKGAANPSLFKRIRKAVKDVPVISKIEFMRYHKFQL